MGGSTNEWIDKPSPVLLLLLCLGMHKSLSCRGGLVPCTMHIQCTTCATSDAAALRITSHPSLPSLHLRVRNRAPKSASGFSTFQKRCVVDEKALPTLLTGKAIAYRTNWAVVSKGCQGC
ncbi:hypothetical protein BKA80DRAFT_262995 [Phyllosticta citrichinensis]